MEANMEPNMDGDLPHTPAGTQHGSQHGPPRYLSHGDLRMPQLEPNMEANMEANMDPHGTFPMVTSPILSFFCSLLLFPSLS